MSAPAKALPRPGSLGAWLLAIRPKTLSAGVMPVIVGHAYAASWYQQRGTPGFLHPELLWGATFVVAIGIQVGTNLVNDVADHFKGADTSERLGPPRVTNLGLLSPRAVVTGACLSFGAAAAAGVCLLLSLHSAYPGASIALVAVLGLASLGCGVLYTVGPASIAYLGLGEIFVLVFFGVFATAGTTFVMTGVWVGDAVVAGIAMGLLAVGLLEANNIRDIATDAPVGKKTLAVRLGDRRARMMYAGVLASAFVVAQFAVRWPYGLVTLSTAPLAWATARPVLKGAAGRDLVKVLQRNSLLEVAFGVLLSLAVIWALPSVPIGPIK